MPPPGLGGGALRGRALGQILLPGREVRDEGHARAVALAGEIEAVGKDVERFTVGDEVYAASGARFGAYAEYICLPGSYPIAAKPTNMTFEEAAGVPLGGTNALHCLRKTKVQKGETVLVNGAGGSFGTFAVQLAKLMGAQVVAVDSTDNVYVTRR